MKHKFIFLVFLLLLLTSNFAFAEEISKAEEIIKGSFPNAQKIAEIDIGAKEISGEVKDFVIAANTGDVMVGIRDTKSIGSTIYYFDRNGNELWSYTTKGKLITIHIARNGESVCAYYESNNIGTTINRVFNKNGTLQYEGENKGWFYPTPDGKHLTYGSEGRNSFQIYDLKTNPTISVPLIKDDCLINFISDNKLLICKYHGLDREGYNKEYHKRKGSTNIFQLEDELLKKYTTSSPKLFLFEYPSLNIIWEYSLSTDKSASIYIPRIVYNDDIFVTCASYNMILCIDRNGSFLWRKKLPFLQGITISDDGNYVLGANQNTIFIINSKTGEVLLEKKFLGTTTTGIFASIKDLSFIKGEILISGIIMQSQTPSRYKATYICSFSKELDFIEGRLENVYVRGLFLNSDKDTQFIGTMSIVENYQKIELFKNRLGGE